MKRTKFLLHITGLLLGLTLILGLGSCGTTRAHFGIEHDMAYNWNTGNYENGPRPYKHKPSNKHKPPKDKHKPGKEKHKAPKPPKHDNHHH